MNYIRAFTGTLPSLGSYVALDFTQIESVASGEHLIAGEGSTDILFAAVGKEVPKQRGTLVRMQSGAVMLFQSAEEQIFMEVWAQFVLESQQQERVESWSKR